MKRIPASGSDTVTSPHPLLLASLAALLAGAAVHVQAQDATAFPNRPVRIVVGYTPGGSTDVMGRQVAQALSKLWGQPVIVENKPGAGGNIGADLVAKSPPDGYTLLMWHDGLAANASLYKKLPFDPVKDLAPVSTIARVSIVMGVAPEFPAHSVKEVIAMAKEKPGSLTYASCGPGTPHHIAGEMFKSYAKVDIVHTAYKGCAPALQDVMGKHVPVFFQTLSNVTEHMKTGRLPVLAVADPTRVPEYPDLPTMIEAGVPGFTLTPWYGILAPGGTPKDLVARISSDIAKVVATPDLQATLKKSHYRPETTTPEQFTEMLATDMVRLGQVIKESGMTAD
jgi:tripartite-type tricarboxylate transporter receptor subunit TctC